MKTRSTYLFWVLVFLSFLAHGAFAQQVRWEFTNGPWYASRVIDMTVGYDGSEPSAYAVNFLGGVLVKSTDGGRTWKHSLKVHLPRSVATISSNPKIVYSGSSSGIRKSTDGGETWTKIPAIRAARAAACEKSEWTDELFGAADAEVSRDFSI